MKAFCLLLLLPIAVQCAEVSIPTQPPVTTPSSSPSTSGTTPITKPTPTPTPSPHPSTTTKTTVTPSTTSTKTTVTPSTTTTSTTTSSTTAPTTTTTSTTIPPKTTTAHPKTTVAPTTTPGPNTTTPAPSPSPSPSPPSPQPAAGSWTVKNETSDVTCVIVNMAIQVNVTYTKTDNKTGFAILNIPKEASANGTCGSEKQALKLEWFHTKNNTNYTNVLEMVFEKNATEKKFVVHDINLMVSVDPDYFPNATQNITNLTLFHNQSLFATSLTRSYRCMKLQEVNLFTKNSNETVGTLAVSKVQLEAFHERNSTDFDAIEDCERSTDIVPITVGCALVGLVAVVLIGYLVGRRRSQARGYLSM